MVKKEAKTRKSIFKKTFNVALVIKAIDGILEVISGALTAFVSNSSLNVFLESIRQGVASSHESGLLDKGILALEKDLNLRSQSILGSFLLSHGIIKIIIVYYVLKGRLWAYPAAIIVFSLFTVIQAIQLISGFSITVAALTIFDILVVILTSIEYREIKKRSAK
jgi:uncharacterized membrane protein